MKEKTKRFYKSVFTNLAFPVFVLPVLDFTLAGWVFLGAQVALMICSGGFHWYEHEKEQMGDAWHGSTGWKWQKADEIAMFFSFWTMLAYLMDGGILMIATCLVAAALMGFRHREFHNSAVGVLALVNVAVKMGQNIVPALASLAFFGAALFMGKKAIETKREELHGFWHIMAAAAKSILVS